MILEIATFDITPGGQAGFEQAFAEARKVIAQAQGHLGHELLRSHEQPAQYVLLVRWETVEDHTEGFRGSSLFGQWRALLQPFFATAPSVGHFHSIAAR
ncbi:antibiotic biosynthesis monooxygenase [Pseudoxanthomonas sp.]|uniref:antibiotic biosynthesis monooxygenase family protein n=1 Tax=Pseudoxanthomonas sp. TaxID=1871049 RepID=UPI002636B280|nr:antibiotic biosynthesis monooxygenase [Pseudoxanthomonas sp.]WDS35047.1 MAG: antibiotic biosynthesis monooxygenase [Pseudoxanthomonas sp.]